MLRPTSQSLLRSSPAALLSSTARPTSRRVPPARRFLSTAPPSQQSRSWKNYGARLALAAGVVYYYNTSALFAEEPAFAHHGAEYENESDNLPTIEALSEQRKQQRALAAQSSATGNAQVAAPIAEGVEGGAHQQPGSVEGLEQEADQQGAFNPETGEINWDCPCLGGMAHGPCGEEFKAAFSCFVYSEADPKGMDCIDKFQGMQTCFRAHPDVYGAELEEDDEYEAQQAAAAAAAANPDSDSDSSSSSSDSTSSDSPNLTSTVPDTLPPTSASSGTIRTDISRPEYTHGDKVAERQNTLPPAEDEEVQKKRQRARKVAEEVREAQDGEKEEKRDVAPGS